MKGPYRNRSLTLINLLLPSSCQRAAGLALRAVAGTPEGAAAGRHDHRSLLFLALRRRRNDSGLCRCLFHAAGPVMMR